MEINLENIKKEIAFIGYKTLSEYIVGMTVQSPYYDAICHERDFGMLGGMRNESNR